MSRALLAVSILFSSVTLAKEFGVQGEQYAVDEESFTTTIINELKRKEANGDLDKFNQDMANQTRQRINRPKVVNHLNVAVNYRTFLVDISKRLEQDVVYNGKVQHKAGEMINPLMYKPYTKHLLFIDGDRAAEVQYALDYAKEHPSKIILTSGSPVELMKKYQVPFKFAQSTVMVDTFHLSVTPSVVYQDGNRMRVEEIPL